MFSQRLSELRKNKKLTQAEFARVFNIATGTIGMWESGKRTPDNETMKKIADFFDVSIDYLVGRSNKLIEPEVVAFHKNTPGDFTDDEKEEIDNFIQYIISKRENK